MYDDIWLLFEETTLTPVILCNLALSKTVFPFTSNYSGLSWYALMNG